MNRIASAIARAFGGAKGIFARKSKRDLEETENSPRSVESLDEGFRKQTVAGGTIYITEPSERAYFDAEEEYSPSIMSVTPSTLAEANAGPRRTARFEDPADEFINASPRAARTEIDYSVFKVRAPPVEEQPMPAAEPESIEMPAEPVSEPELIEATVPETSPVEEVIAVEEIPVTEAEEPVVETVFEAEPVAVPEPVFEAPVSEPVIEVEEIEAPVETAAEVPAEAPLLLAAPAPAEEPEAVIEVPVESEVIFEAPVEAPVEIETEDKTPAEEIDAFGMFPGMAGISAVAPTSSAAAAPVISLRGENDLFGIFCPGLAVEGDDLSNSEEFAVDTPDDGLEEFFCKLDKEVEEQEAAEIAYAAMLAAEAARQPVEVPAYEEPAVEAPIEEAPAVEAPVQEAPAGNMITAEEEAIFRMLAGDAPEAPAVEAPAPAVEAPVEEEIVFHIPEVEEEPYVAPAPAPVFEAPVEEEIVFHIPEVEEEPYVAPAPAPVFEAPVEEDIVFHIPEVEEEPYVAPTPVEPVVEVFETEEVPAPVFETPTVEEAPVEVASETVSETPSGVPQKVAEPAIISRRAVNPADVAAILFG